MSTTARTAAPPGALDHILGMLAGCGELLELIDTAQRICAEGMLGVPAVERIIRAAAELRAHHQWVEATKYRAGGPETQQLLGSVSKVLTRALVLRGCPDRHMAERLEYVRTALGDVSRALRATAARARARGVSGGTQ